jgi:hypothetical protein
VNNNQDNLYLDGKEFENLWVSIQDFLCGIGPRGFLTCLGFRKTAGSKEILPPSKEELLLNFNKNFSSKYMSNICLDYVFN